MRRKEGVKEGKCQGRKVSRNEIVNNVMGERRKV